MSTLCTAVQQLYDTTVAPAYKQEVLLYVSVSDIIKLPSQHLGRPEGKTGKKQKLDRFSFCVIESIDALVWILDCVITNFLSQLSIATDPW